MNYKVLFEKTPLARMFVIITIPGIIGMVVSSLYQIIDGAFVGQILGSNAFAAVNLAVPLVILNFSLADLIGVGSSVPIAIKLGEKDEKSASNIFTSACIMIIATGTILGAIIYFFAEDFVRLMGADEELVAMASQYLRVYAACSPFTTIIFAIDNYLRICGKVRFSMIVNVLMSVIGIILEYLFLSVFHFGIWSAAFAECVGMFVCVIIAFMPFLLGKMQLRFTRPKMDGYVLLTIVKNGSPVFLDNIAGRVTSIIINIFLLRLGGATAVSAYGVLMYVDGLVQPALYGFCDSLQPAVGYNYGAKNYDRVDAIERRCFAACGILSVSMAAVMFFARKYVVGIFVQAQDVAVINMSLKAISLFACTYLTRWISISVQSYMSAIGKAGYATIISFSMAFVLPVMFIFALKSFGLKGIWLNMPLVSLAAAVLAAGLLMNYRKELAAEFDVEGLS